jgi:hypothetical protein
VSTNIENKHFLESTSFGEVALCPHTRQKNTAKRLKTVPVTMVKAGNITDETEQKTVREMMPTIHQLKAERTSMRYVGCGDLSLLTIMYSEKPTSNGITTKPIEEIYAFISLLTIHESPNNNP